MTEDEKRGFRNGCRVMLKMMEGGAYMLQDGGQRAIAEAVFGFVDHAEQDVESMTEMYADHGYDAIMKALEEREEEDERWLN